MPGYINNFRVIADIDKLSPGDIRFYFYVNPREMSKNELEKLSRLLAKDYNAGSEPGGIVHKKFKIKAVNFPNNIETNLKNFACKLTEWEFTPA